MGERSLSELVRQVVAETETLGSHAYDSPSQVLGTATAVALLDRPPAELVEVALAALEMTANVDLASVRPGAQMVIGEHLAAAAMRDELPFRDDQLVLLAELLEQIRHPGTDHALTLLGLALPAIERGVGIDGVASAELADPLRRLAAQMTRFDVPFEGPVRASVRRLTDPAAPRGPLPASEDPWTEALLTHRTALAGREREIADAVLKLAMEANGSKPSRRFQHEVERAVGEFGSQPVGRSAGALLAVASKVSSARVRFVMPSDLADTLRGLCWIAGTAGGPDAARGLADMAVAGWRSIPGVGKACVKAGRAAIDRLAAIPEGAVFLSGVRAQVKQASAVRLVDDAIDRAAVRMGVSRVEFEEQFIPDFGLGRDGVSRRQLGDYTVELRLVSPLGCQLGILDRYGRKLKTAPAALRSAHSSELAETRLIAKDIHKAVASQRHRIERLFLDQRSWPAAAWKSRYLHHGLVGHLARRLIWRLQTPTGTQTVIWRDGQLRDATDAVVTLDEPAVSVSLWHPSDATVDEVVAWRSYLEGHEIQQPFKQAHREIYLLTDAERQSRTFSMRFAAHILRQHQMAALARGRGWTYQLQGWWEGTPDHAQLDLPAHTLSAALRTSAPWDDQNVNDASTFIHIVTHEVRFQTCDGWDVALEDVPARVFSEVMRDVDLLVGVTSIANDPTWLEHGDPVHHGYWHSQAFGDLAEHAASRREILHRLLPRLAIADAAQIEGKFLRVQGQLRAYKIHLGSTNVLMEPNDEYLCIVPRPGPKPPPQVFLPFEGDPALDVIISKALMLASDDQITDPTILHQIRP